MRIDGAATDSSKYRAQAGSLGSIFRYLGGRFMQRSRRLFSVFIFLIVPFLQAADWPGFLGPNYDGTTRDGQFGTTGGGLVVAWQRNLGSGYSGIAVSGNHAVTLFSDGVKDFAAALDTASGKELWRYEIGPTYKGHDGSQDGPLATPAIAGDRVYGLSAKGELFALNLESGKSHWSVNTAKNFNAKEPIYGFTTSPLVAGDVLVVQVGGDKGRAVAGFDAKSGKALWTTGEDVIAYQSPVLMRIANKAVVIAVGNARLYAIDPVSGKVLLDYEHGGAGQAEVMVPALVENDRLLLRNKSDSTDLVRIVSTADGKLSVEKLWSAGVFKNSYNVPIHHKGFLYGFSGRVLTCVDAANGQIKWRSRTAGDGFALLVDDQLIIQTKDGKVHAGPATPEGWKETSKLELFKKIAWTPPSFAAGAVFTRSMGEIARLNWGSVTASGSEINQDISFGNTRFAEFLAEVKKSNNKKEVIDRFWSSIQRFPLVEWPDRVYFLYRGPAEDIAVTGDHVSFGREEPMQRISGTDLFYYATTLEPDARINYRFLKNYDEIIADPHNNRTTVDRRGKPLSWMAMPGWKEPAHLKEAAADRKGKIETHAIESKLRKGGSAKIEVYVPVTYGSEKEPLPTLYLFGGPEVQTQGTFTNSLDNLIGNSVKPVIVVYLKELKTGPEPIENPAEEMKALAEMIAKEIVPFVDGHYKTNTRAAHRAAMGAGYEGNYALYLAFGYPELFGGVATQSAFLQEHVANPVREIIVGPDKHPVRIYIDWGIYDYRSDLEGWNNATENEKFYRFVRDKGYKPAGGQVHEGAGWPNWRNRTDRVLATLFPLTE